MTPASRQKRRSATAAVSARDFACMNAHSGYISDDSPTLERLGEPPAHRVASGALIEELGRLLPA